MPVKKLLSGSKEKTSYILIDLGWLLKKKCVSCAEDFILRSTLLFLNCLENVFLSNISNSCYLEIPRKQISPVKCKFKKKILTFPK
jgi:hypothetical protein